MEIRNVEILKNWKCYDGNRTGELCIKAIKGSKFLGFKEPFEGMDEEWIETG